MYFLIFLIGIGGKLKFFIIVLVENRPNVYMYNVISDKILFIMK